MKCKLNLPEKLAPIVRNTVVSEVSSEKVGYKTYEYQSGGAAWLTAELDSAFVTGGWAFYAVGPLVLCATLVLIPQMLLLMGAGLWLSGINHNLAYIIIALVFFMSFSSSPFLDIPGGSIMAIPANAIPVRGVFPSRFLRIILLQGCS